MKVKRRVLALALVIIIAMLFLVGCYATTYQNAKNVNGEEFVGGYFTKVKEWGVDNQFKIVYANDTKVMYYIDINPHGSGITPLYNADGTLQIYEEE